MEDDYGLQGYKEIIARDLEVLAELAGREGLPAEAYERARLPGSVHRVHPGPSRAPRQPRTDWRPRYTEAGGSVRTGHRSSWLRLLRSEPALLLWCFRQRAALSGLRRIVDCTGREGLSALLRHFCPEARFFDCDLARPMPGMKVPMVSHHALCRGAGAAAVVVEEGARRGHTEAFEDLLFKSGAAQVIVLPENGGVPRLETAESRDRSGEGAQPVEWPRISVVTASFNQRRFLSKCIDSVLGQNYPNLEFIIIDGCSTDGSVELLESRRDRFSRLVIEPDRGQSHALNKGFELATGDILTWLCSDDLLEPGALATVGRAWRPGAWDMLVGGCRVIDDGDRTKFVHHSGFPTNCLSPLSFGDMASFTSTWQRGLYFFQPEVFFTRDLWQRAGAHVKEHLHYAMDYEMFLRFALAGASVLAVKDVLACSRQHDEQKTRHDTPLYLPTVSRILEDFRRDFLALEGEAP